MVDVLTYRHGWVCGSCHSCITKGADEYTREVTEDILYRQPVDGNGHEYGINKHVIDEHVIDEQNERIHFEYTSIFVASTYMHEKQFVCTVF